MFIVYIIIFLALLPFILEGLGIALIIFVTVLELVFTGIGGILDGITSMFRINNENKE